jgi:hypothetical protein
MNPSRSKFVLQRLVTKGTLLSVEAAEYGVFYPVVNFFRKVSDLLVWTCDESYYLLKDPIEVFVLKN